MVAEQDCSWSIAREGGGGAMGVEPRSSVRQAVSGRIPSPVAEFPSSPTASQPVTRRAGRQASGSPTEQKANGGARQAPHVGVARNAHNGGSSRDADAQSRRVNIIQHARIIIVRCGRFVIAPVGDQPPSGRGARPHRLPARTGSSPRGRAGGASIPGQWRAAADFRSFLRRTGRSTVMAGPEQSRRSATTGITVMVFLAGGTLRRAQGGRGIFNGSGKDSRAGGHRRPDLLRRTCQLHVNRPWWWLQCRCPATGVDAR